MKFHVPRLVALGKTCCGTLLLIALSVTPIRAGSATWQAAPSSGDWNTSANWVEATVPNSAADTATFGVSSGTGVSISANTQVDGITFNAGASVFTVTVASTVTLSLTGVGVVNNSSGTESFVTAGAGAQANGKIIFSNRATAATGAFTNEGGTTADALGGEIEFRDVSSAGSGVFLNTGGVVNSAAGGRMTFTGTSTAGHATITNTSANAHGDNHISNSGGVVIFRQRASAGDSTIISQGQSWGIGGAAVFFDSSTAGNSTLSAASASNVGGSYILFADNSSGGTAAVNVTGSGFLQVVDHASGLTLGSIEGDGVIMMVSQPLTVGSNNRSTIFKGAISGAGSSLIKIGSGTLTIADWEDRFVDPRASTYYGGTTISGGTLLANGAGNATLGTGPVTVARGGTLGGYGAISGLTTVSAGGHLAPGDTSGTLRLANGLTLASGAILDFRLGSYGSSINVSSGTLTVPLAAGSVTLNLANAGGFAPGVAYVLMNFVAGHTSGLSVASFSFGRLIGSTVPSDYTLSLTDTSLSVTYNGDANAIPEPPPMAPSITSATGTTVLAGQPMNFPVTATGAPRPTFSAVGLPSWATLDSTTGAITGTPTDATGSPFSVTLTASNGISPDAAQTFTLTVRVAPAFVRQPADQAVTVGDDVRFSVSANGNPTATYQWQLSATGGASWMDLSNSEGYLGSTTSTLDIANATFAMNGCRYRCVATNSAGSVSSNAATLTVRAPALSGTYFGAFPNNHGRWALRVESDNTAVYIAYLTSRNSAIVVHLTIGADGTFTSTGTEMVPLTTNRVMHVLSNERAPVKHAQAIAAGFTLTGRISSGAVDGQLTGLGETFSGVADSAGGAAASGFYEASALNTASGTAYAIVAPSGQVLVVTVTSTSVDGAIGTVGGNGQLTATTAGGGQLTLALNGSNQSIVSTLTPAGATAPISFAGLVDGIASTTHLANIATRAYCSTGNRVTIGGFVVSGSAPKHVFVRAVGPSLTAQGIGPTEVLLDPVIEVHDASHGNVVIATNDNWGDNTNAGAITTTASAVGATALLGSDTKSSALLRDLAPGVYSFVVKSRDDSSGIVLLEVYDADAAATGADFSNIATRAYATTGNGVTIGGFVITGNAPKHVLLRAVGPTLSHQGLGVTELLTDPVMELHDASHGNATIATNDNWADNANAAAITTTGARIGATPLDVADTTSSALLVTLQPGVYSFIAQGKTGAPSGIVLVEVYDAD